MAKIRISAVPFKAGQVSSFDDFADHVTRLVEQAAAEKPDFVVFPELFTSELLNFFEGQDIVEKFARLTEYTEDYVSLFRGLSKEKGFYIVGGSHLKEVRGKFYNTGHLFTPDGEVWEQQKCHLVPIETAWTAPSRRDWARSSKSASLAFAQSSSSVSSRSPMRWRNRLHPEAMPKVSRARRTASESSSS